MTTAYLKATWIVETRSASGGRPMKSWRGVAVRGGSDAGSLVLFDVDTGQPIERFTTSGQIDITITEEGVGIGPCSSTTISDGFLCLLRPYNDEYVGLLFTTLQHIADEARSRVGTPESRLENIAFMAERELT